MSSVILLGVRRIEVVDLVVEALELLYLLLPDLVEPFSLEGERRLPLGN